MFEELIKAVENPVNETHEIEEIGKFPFDVKHRIKCHKKNAEVDIMPNGYPISNCPFCGEYIKHVEVDREK